MAVVGRRLTVAAVGPRGMGQAAEDVNRPHKIGVATTTGSGCEHVVVDQERALPPLLVESPHLVESPFGGEPGFKGWLATRSAVARRVVASSRRV